MKISKAALNATIEELTCIKTASGKVIQHSPDEVERITEIIQAYSERLPDLVEIGRLLLEDPGDEKIRSSTWNKLRNALAEMEN